MSTMLSCNYSDTPFSYQHIQGTMLVNLNKLAYKLALSHSEYRLMGMLIGFWNKEKDKAFPTIDLLAHTCRMSKSTIIKNLSRLSDKKLIIIVKTKGKRNCYNINKVVFAPDIFQNVAENSSTSCKTTHVNKQIKKKLFIMNDKKHITKKDLPDNINCKSKKSDKIPLLKLLKQKYKLE